jgi:hypothetical protein
VTSENGQHLFDRSRMPAKAAGQYSVGNFRFFMFDCRLTALLEHA